MSWIDTSQAVPLTIPGGGAPGPRIRARAFGRIEDTLSVLDKYTALTQLTLETFPRARKSLPTTE